MNAFKHAYSLCFSASHFSTSHFSATTLLLVSVACGFSPATADAASGHAISFDLPPTAVAIPVTTLDAASSPAYGSGDTVEVALRLSSLVSGEKVPEIDRWMIRCVPRDASWRVVDYAPRTETASDYDGPIEYKKIDEQTNSLGMSFDATPLQLGGAHAGFDTNQKEGETMQYRRQAPLHAVTASGTIERGRGVYYKLRWTSTQVLEGEKEFKVTFQVPVGFRAGLLDVSVVAMGRTPSSSKFSSIPVLGDDSNKVHPIGQGRFAVAVHAEGDPVAWRLAKSMADTEQVLRSEASKIRTVSATHSLSTLIRHVAAKIDIESDAPSGAWVDRLVFQNADPYTDPVIRKLPTQLRVVALDYCDARRKLQRLETQQLADSSTSFQLNDWVKASIQQ
ncbi:hypothetical protein SAMN06265222_10124 [Neorhodopirellula lusitana]|uniref:Uncharacterized protein n=1 Tax=Neorhodopirellula lusitana TaxID=445327 RepID=A0ABY1PNZ1_9BACT|nr:hypothetical protein [Neorhodopirellula lusitana]SMP37764.1 hypothetical protein SAMN06265222_10124 [Neorhodopirellula lusitana]